MPKLFYTPLILLLFFQVAGQESDTLVAKKDSAVQEVLFNTDQTYDDHIQTVIISPANAPTSFPVITLNGGKIRLQFDDLRDDYIEYFYKLVHCDKDWIPTKEDSSEYFQSTATNNLDNYSFSSETKVGFTHYTLDLPGPYDRFLKSGNYLIHIFERRTGERKLTSRFVILDPVVSVSGNVVRTDDGQYSDYLQQIKFKVIDSRSEVKDMSRIYARIHKNQSWEISCDQLQPSYVLEDVITFDRTEKCYFDGGNEYRQFNMIDYRNISNNIVRVNHLGNGPSKIWLDDDKPRSFLKYSTANDRNGTCQYTGDFKAFEPTRLDYAEVTFSLKTEDAMLGYEIYVFGEMCHFRLEERCRMTFNPDNGRYEATLLLKQGLYDYEYVVRSPYQELPEEGLIEGSHAETENDYFILIYYRSQFAGYDRLIGMERINSVVKNQTFYKNN